MASVTGIGCIFFRAKDPEALSTWYEEIFRITRVPGDYSSPPWRQQAGPTVFAPFPRDTVYFGDP
jgi:glyoxylase I family protein